MAQNVTEVFRAAVPSVGLVLKARADIDGKQNAYRRRIAEDAEGDESAALTEYSANVDCTFNFAGGDAEKDMPFVAGGDAVKALPVFFETRYFFRGDFKPVDGRKVKDVRVEHRMASLIIRKRATTWKYLKARLKRENSGLVSATTQLKSAARRHLRGGAELPFAAAVDKTRGYGIIYKTVVRAKHCAGKGKKRK